MLLNWFRCIRSGFTVRILRHFRKIIPNITDKRVCHIINAFAGLHGNQFVLPDRLVQITGGAKQLIFHIIACPFSLSVCLFFLKSVL